MSGWVIIGIAGTLIAYTFAGYPLLLWIAGRVRSHAPRADASDSDWPSVSITVPVYNEAHQIDALLESLASLDYPRDRLQILIVSDGSNDGTDARVRAWADRGVELLSVGGRQGKGAAENTARPCLRGEIIVNTDASIRIRPEALRAIVRPFRDPDVGVASGRDVSVGREAEESNEGEAGYVGYEMLVRDLETAVGGIVGASGCFYATRRELHEVEVPPELSRDFGAALIAQDHGYRAVSVPSAVCLVPRTASLRTEYRRKVRTIARGMSTLIAWGRHLNPLNDPVFAWKLWSHKVCRWMLPAFVGVFCLGLALLAAHHAWALASLAAVLLILLLAVAGWALAGRVQRLPRMLSVPAFVLASNIAVLHALARALTRGSEPVWEPTRREGAGATPG